tara:strand:+ start:417 stop:692 length:276 start_codon:yes stop_codon:yes gene_type:complete
MKDTEALSVMIFLQQKSRLSIADWMNRYLVRTISSWYRWHNCGDRIPEIVKKRLAELKEEELERRQLAVSAYQLSNKELDSMRKALLGEEN